MQLDRKHPRPGRGQGGGDHTVAGAKINNELPRTYSRVDDKFLRPFTAQPVPSPESLLCRRSRPSLPCPGHDAP
ncbi:hypothetical protein GCM10011575_31580 [Microlunatus endophyticus]|uniref:Uncharacterized protein n=1 Tax=Microlunatus endophyticus TaxID=1716077 RepID=A0A917SDG5_9ACTN|nr:hypothetical protein GCM10011575_31580 [Microlunatus endophyticus]